MCASTREINARFAAKESQFLTFGFRPHSPPFADVSPVLESRRALTSGMLSYSGLAGSR